MAAGWTGAGAGAGAGVGAGPSTGQVIASGGSKSEGGDVRGRDVRGGDLEGLDGGNTMAVLAVDRANNCVTRLKVYLQATTCASQVSGATASRLPLPLTMTTPTPTPATPTITTTTASATPTTATAATTEVQGQEQQQPPLSTPPLTGVASSSHSLTEVVDTADIVSLVVAGVGVGVGASASASASVGVDVGVTAGNHTLYTPSLTNPITTYRTFLYTPNLTLSYTPFYAHIISSHPFHHPYPQPTSPSPIATASTTPITAVYR